MVGSAEWPLSSDGDLAIVWPVVVCGEPQAGEINGVLDYRQVTGESLWETVTNYREFGRGITSSDYRVNHLDDDFLDITVSWSFVGAYPSEHERSFLFSLETGMVQEPADLFAPEAMEALAVLCNEKLSRNIQAETAMDPPVSAQRDHVFTVEHLATAGMRSEGIVFLYPFDYPHAFKAAEPDGEPFFTWSELEGYLLPGIARR